MLSLTGTGAIASIQVIADELHAHHTCNLIPGASLHDDTLPHAQVTVLRATVNYYFHIADLVVVVVPPLQLPCFPLPLPLSPRLPSAD